MRNSLRLTALLGALAVAVGAFGAHGLRSLVGPEDLLTFGTGVRYHFYHVLACGLAVAVAALPGSNRKWLRWAIRSWVAGILLFSGSLYLLSLRSVVGVSVGWLGPITPLGGVFFIFGWGFLFLAAANLSRDA